MEGMEAEHYRNERKEHTAFIYTQEKSGDPKILTAIGFFSSLAVEFA